MSGWIVSPRFDGLWFAGAPLLAAAVAAVMPERLDLGLPGWLLLVVGFDVAHVWSTLWRTWLDPSVADRRPHTNMLLAAAVGCGVVQALAPGAFWRAMAALAVFHFVRQQAGFGAIYRGRAGVPADSWDARVEHAALHALCLFPIVWWCAHLPRAFVWFVAGDFPAVPAWVVLPAGVVTAALVVAHVGLRLRSGVLHPGRDLWFFGTAATWFVGIVLRDGDAPFTVANVLGHAVPYFALVHAASPGRPWRWAPMFLLVPVAAALAEELAWDVFVWQERGPFVVEGLAGFATAVLAVPQVTHYLLDGVIWKRSARGRFA